MVSQNNLEAKWVSQGRHLKKGWHSGAFPEYLKQWCFCGEESWNKRGDCQTEVRKEDIASEETDERRKRVGKTFSSLWQAGALGEGLAAVFQKHYKSGRIEHPKQDVLERC